MSAFKTALILEDDGGLPFALHEPLVYQSDLLGFALTIPAGFQTDLASIPRGLWNILPRVGKWDAASVVHDFLYQYDTAHIARDLADRVFREAMEVSGVGWWSRHVLYWGVRIGGGIAWDHYREAAGV